MACFGKSLGDRPKKPMIRCSTEYRKAMRDQANIQASLAAPDRQLGRYYDINLQIRKNTMQGLTQAAFITYVDNEEMLENYLDESLMAHYKGNYDDFERSRSERNKL